ncbi:MAG: GxxExxY protein [Planctomycetes bacterium]|nr:GxxExxY protein [Planctomycetota bacterium]MCW8136218.1 GxxExxY protein [Planctomycetota bacterium]
MKHAELTERIIGVAIEVFRELGTGFVEAVYQRSLLIALRQAGFGVRGQVEFPVLFRGENVGTYFADILVDETIVLELKAVTRLVAEHKSQLINYLKASGPEVGLLLNFGGARLEFQRLEHPDLY